MTKVEEEEGDPEVKFTKPWFKKYGVPAAFAILSLVLALWSSIQVINAYNILSGNTDDFLATVKNWETQPVINVTLVASGDGCPYGYEQSTSVQGYWHGADAYCNCKCTSNPPNTYTSGWYDPTNVVHSAVLDCTKHTHPQDSSNEAFSHVGHCDSNETLSDCEDIDSVSGVRLGVLGGWKICVLRGGLSPLERNKLDLDKKYYDDGACASGYQQCGTDPYTICASTNYSCPLFYSYFDFGTGTVERVGLNETTPVTEFYVASDTRCRLQDKKRHSQRTYGNTGSSVTYPYVGYKRWSEQLDDSCEQIGEELNEEDIRWQTSSSKIPEWQIFQENSMPEGFKPSDFCTVPSTCDKVQSVEWDVKIRPEVTWGLAFKEDCAVTMVDLADNKDPVKEAVGYQLALMVLNIIANLILGIIIPASILWNVLSKKHDVPCCPGKGDEEKAKLDAFSKWGGVVAKIVKFIPLVACLVILRSLTNIFIDACSDDDITNHTFTSLSTIFSDTYDSNLTTLGVDIAMILLQVVLVIWEKFKKPESDKESAPLEAVKTGDEAEYHG